jgi:hypothetical protein
MTASAFMPRDQEAKSQHQGLGNPFAVSVVGANSPSITQRGTVIFDPRQKSRAFAEQQALEDRHAVRVREYGVEGD